MADFKASAFKSFAETQHQHIISPCLWWWGKLILLTGSISRECRRYILFQEKNKRALVFVPYFSPLYLTPISPTPSTKEKNRAGIKRNCSWH